MAQPATMIPGLDHGKTFLDYLLDPARLKAYIEELTRLDQSLADKLGAVKTRDDADRLLAQASAEKAEASAMRASAMTMMETAETSLGTARQHAATLLTETDGRVAAVLADARTALSTIQTVLELSQRGQEAITRRMNDLESATIEATRRAGAAEAAKTEYERRLAAIQLVARGE